MTATDLASPAVWIGSLHAYNRGSLIGEWTDAADLDHLEAVARRVVQKGGGEEFALMDFEGFGKMIGEYTPLARVAQIAEAIEEHGDALILYATGSGFGEEDDVEEFVERFESAHAGGGYESLKDYAEEHFHELQDVPDGLLPYIDYAAFEQTLESAGYRFDSGHVFRPA